MCIAEGEKRRMDRVGLAVVGEAVVHTHHTAESGYAGHVHRQHALGRKPVPVLRLE